MGKVLYRKYRSKSLDEIVGQAQIVTALKQALKNARVPHALLLSGPRGVGKTSVARIIAHAVNELQYDEDAGYLDIIEIDAASNRRIDEIRDLREKVHIAPARAKFKVYIIDELHMLTREAFSALLKTLEEPPAHAIFILATTEPHKLPPTIISRTQRFNFKPVDKNQMVERLSQIAQKEKIDISKEALELLAEHSDGSFRDALSLLDQVGAGQTRVEAADVKTALGLAPAENLIKLLDSIVSRDAEGLVETLTDLRVQGVNAGALAKQLSGELRGGLLRGEPILAASQIIKLLEQLLDVGTSGQAYGQLEITLLGAVFDSSRNDIKNPSEPSPKKPEITLSPPKQITESEIKTKQSSEPLSAKIWEDTLAIIKKERNTLYSIARMAKPQFADGRLLLYFTFPFHQKRLDETKNRQFIADQLKTLTGSDFEIVCLLEDSADGQAKPVETEPEQISPAVKTISNIFGGAEVIE